MAGKLHDKFLFSGKKFLNIVDFTPIFYNSHFGPLSRLQPHTIRSSLQN